jgi:hypothetical protein
MPQAQQPTSPLLWLSRSLSLLFHPIWLPLVFASWQAWGDPQLPKLLLVIFVFVIAFPGAVALLWMWIRKEMDWFVMAQANRLVPMVATLIGLAFFAVANGGLLPERLFQGKLLAVMILLVFISILVNLFWKISVHMLSWGAAVAFTGYFAWTSDEWLLLILCLAISGIVAWARHHVGSHDWAQIIVGWLSGIAAATLIVAAFP